MMHIHPSIPCAVAAENPALILQKYVERHNLGVRTGDFSTMLALLDRDARMVLQGRPAGPFAGRAAIAEAFAENPPDDELIIAEPGGGAHAASAAYAWKTKPSAPAGRISIE